MKKLTLISLLILCLTMAACQPAAAPTAVVFPTSAPTETTAPATAEPTSTPVEATATVILPTAEPTATAAATPEHPVSLTHIHMADSQNGMAIGGDFGLSNLFLVTHDGGSTWTDMSPVTDMINGNEGGWSLAAGFYGSNQTWLMLSPADLTQPNSVVVIYSTDGGSTFLFSDPLDVTGLEESFFVGQIQFVDENTGWLLAHVGAGMNHDYIAIYQTVDGGATWQRMLDPFSPDAAGIHSCAKTGMLFTDTEHGYLTGSCNGVAPGVLLFATSDSGSTWQKVELPEPSDQSGLFDSQDAACGSENPQVDGDGALHLTVACHLYASDPPETHWYTYELDSASGEWTGLPYPGGLITYLSGQTWLAQSPDWQISTDSGANWTSTGTLDYTVSQFQQLGDILFAVAQGETDARLLSSTDQGQTWQIIPTGLN